ncbi:MAG: hypothetical protein KF812_01365 [Fimbriimonadaceae bacterium]|nr:hypothetical protein [Fimbriimonadaceae bacterium]
MSWLAKILVGLVAVVAVVGLYSVFAPPPPDPNAITNEEKYREVYAEAIDQALPLMEVLDSGVALSEAQLRALDEAGDKLDQVNKFRPDDFRSYVLLSRIRLALGDDESAKAAYRQAELNLPTRIPDNERTEFAEIQYGFAEVGYQLGEYERAATQLNQAINLVPHPKYDLLKARILVQQQAYDAAMEILNSLRLDAEQGEAADQLIEFIRRARAASSESAPTSGGSDSASLGS